MKGKYDTHVEPKLKLIEGWARSGLIEAEIIKRLDVSQRAFSDYKTKYPQLVQALKNSKEEADYTVENSLFKRANGMEYWEVVEELRMDKKTGVEVMMEVKRTKKWLAPDPTSMIFWLKNRDKVNWSDRKDVNVTGNMKLEDFFKV